MLATRSLVYAAIDGLASKAGIMLSCIYNYACSHLRKSQIYSVYYRGVKIDILLHRVKFNCCINPLDVGL